MIGNTKQIEKVFDISNMSDSGTIVIIKAVSGNLTATKKVIIY